MLSQLTIVFEPAEEGGFTAFIPEVPGAISEGETLEEARDMVMEALHDLLVFRREVVVAKVVFDGFPNVSHSIWSDHFRFR